MRETFTDTETSELERLLNKVAANGGYWPDEKTMRAGHGAMSAWAPELVIVQERKALLRLYEEGAEEFLGKFHLPGGYNRWPELDIQATCSRIGLREIGVDVIYNGTIDTYKWKPGEHPYGRPLSVYAACALTGEVQESEKMRFFSAKDLPGNMVEPHRRFLEGYLR